MRAKKKKIGRPRTGITPAVGLRLSLDVRRKVERWAARQPDKPTLSESIRRLLDKALG